MDLVDDLNDRLLFAVPKKGRLHKACMDLLAGSDVQFHRSERLDVALVNNQPLALVFLGAGDIPAFVSKGRVDLGITGRDQIAEYEIAKPPSATVGVEEILDLEFGKCKLQVQVPKAGNIEKPEQLVGTTIFTSFPNLTTNYFRKLEDHSSQANGTANGGAKKEPQTEIDHIGGSVEIACALKSASGIVDLVESGATMRAAGLKAIATVMESTAVLIRSKSPSDPKLVDTIANRIRGFIDGQKYMLFTYNVNESNIDNALKITPGKRAPTVSQLKDPGWFAVSSMVLRSGYVDIMDELARAGAQDILVMRMENTRTT